MKYFAGLFTIAILLLCFVATAKNINSTNDSAVIYFNRFIYNGVSDEIMVQTDRKIYAAGENIWFKALVVNAINNGISARANNLFADLVDDNDSVITALVLNNRQGFNAGAFYLPASLKSGFYWLRCYTAQMPAGNADGIFIKPLYVLNSTLHDATAYNRLYRAYAGKASKAEPVIHFYAERLTGIPAIISTGVLQISGGESVVFNLSGNVVNSRDSIVATFTTNSLGLARINFIDDATEKYTAIIHAVNHDIRYALPPLEHSAAQLSFAKQTSNSIKAFVTLEDSLAPAFRATIFGLYGDSLCYAAVGTGTYGIDIPLDNFAGGIATFLLVDDKQHILSERKIFIDKENYDVKMQSGQAAYKPRENVALDFTVTDANGLPLQSVLSISVQPAELAQLADSVESGELPLPNRLLLTSWLNANAYKYSKADIDMIMMTLHSTYKKSETVPDLNKEAMYDDAENLLNLHGKIIDTRGRLVKNRVVTAILKNRSNYFIQTDTTKANGVFKIELPQNTDSFTTALQVTDKHGIERLEDSVIINNFVFPVVTTPAALKQKFIARNILMLALMQKNHADTALISPENGLLKNVTVVAVAKPVLNYDESKRINSISQILSSDNFRYGGYGAIGYALLTVPGVSLSGGDLTIFGPSMDMRGNIGRPLLIVDGVEMGSATLGYFNSLSPADIDFIEVLRGAEAGIYGMRAANGVISVNTRKGPPVMLNTKNNLRTVNPVTYHVNPPFIMPDYSIPEIKNRKLPDQRTTIYWKGNLMTDSTGHARVNFYTADKPADYIVTITGLSAKGDIVYKRFTVSRK